MEFFLASTSPYRQKLLARLGLAFRVAAPPVDEETIHERTPKALALARAIAKARAVAELHPSALVLGSDQVCALDDEVLSKPGTEEKARAQLAKLSGKTHHLYTAIALVSAEDMLTHVDTSHLTMRTLTADAIASYVRREMPLDCAGSYKIENLGIALLETVVTDDTTGIEGLPLLATCRLLRTLGIEPLDAVR